MTHFVDTSTETDKTNWYQCQSGEDWTTTEKRKTIQNKRL